MPTCNPATGSSRQSSDPRRSDSKSGQGGCGEGDAVSPWSCRTSLDPVETFAGVLPGLTGLLVVCLSRASLPFSAMASLRRHSVDLGQAGQRGQVVIAEDQGPAHRQARDVRGFIPFLRPISLLRSFIHPQARSGAMRCQGFAQPSAKRLAFACSHRSWQPSVYRIRRAIPFRRGNAITHALGTDRIVGRGSSRPASRRFRHDLGQCAAQSAGAA